MIKLTRLLLIHWQAYDFQLIEFDQITLITGQTGVGKSTIIDALSLITMGEKQKHIFNKAAHEKADRTLESYLYGKLGDDGGEGFLYLREGDFTSYVVAEFKNEDTNEFFCCGIVADCLQDHSAPVLQWLTMFSKLPNDCFVDPIQNIPYSIQELSYQNIQKSEHEKINFTTTDKEYRNKIANLFGHIRTDYRRLLKQAVSFTPVQSIETFLTDSLSETENQIDVIEMQNTIRRYNDLEIESTKIKQKVVQLEKITTELNQLTIYERTQKKYIYFIKKAEIEKLKKQEVEYRTSVSELNKMIKESTQQLFEIERKLQLLLEQRKYNQIKRDQLVVLRDKVSLEKEIQQLTQSVTICQQETNYAKTHLKSTLSFIADLKKIKLSETDHQIVQSLEAYQTPNQYIQRFEQLNQLLSQLLSSLRLKEYELQTVMKELSNQILELRKQESKLKQGEKLIPLKLKQFREDLLEYLQQKNPAAQVEFLCDAIEIKSNEIVWQPAIEAYLNAQRYYLIIEPEFYQQAIQFYQSIQKKDERFGIGIIHLQKISQQTIFGKSSSLAQKITTKNPLVQNYIDFLLGKVITCSHIEQLEQYNTAITADGFLYKNFVIRKLPLQKLQFVVGKEALVSQLKEVRTKIDKLQQNQDNLKIDITNYQQLTVYADKDEYVCDKVRQFADGKKLQFEKQKLSTVKTKLENLDDSELILLDQKITHLHYEYEQLIKEQIKTKRTIEDCEKREQQIKISLIECNHSLLSYEKLFKTQFQVNSDIENYEIEYHRAIQEKEQLEYELFIKTYQKKQEKLEIKSMKLKEGIQELMFMYNQNFYESLPIQLTKANIYKEEYQKYLESDLPRFEETIRDARKKAMHEFRYEFLGKLKNNIESVYRQVHEINTALKQYKFGEDSYRFKLTAAAAYQEYYDMIMDEMLMDQGEWNLLSAAFESKYAKQIERLFSILAGEDLETGAMREQHIRLFSNYQTYLDFEMLVKKGDMTQRLSKTYNSKSGGEMQIPLYISLLAAFSQVYRVNTKRNHTIRLIIMDEAFSKIDGEKIKQCIQLIKHFGLQAIFSTPPDKISEIMEEASKALVVFRSQNKVLLKEFSSSSELFEIADEV